MVIPSASSNVDASRDIAMRATDIPHQKKCPDNDERNKVLAILVNSPFWPRLGEIENESAKFNRLTRTSTYTISKVKRITPSIAPGMRQGYGIY